MDPQTYIAFLKAQLAQTQASLRYEKSLAEAAERRLRAFEQSRVGGFVGTISTGGSRSAYQTPSKGNLHYFGSPASASDDASTQPYGSPGRTGILYTPQKGEPGVLRSLRKDAQDLESLQHELELHSTISPAFLEELQRLWWQYTNATDVVIEDAMAKAQTEGVRQALHGLRMELRRGSIYPSYELTRAGSLPSMFQRHAASSFAQAPAPSAPAAARPRPNFTTPRSGTNKAPPAHHSKAPFSLSSSDDEVLEQGQWDSKSVPVSPLIYVERKAAAAAAAVRACPKPAISEPDAERSMPLIASSCLEYETLKRQARKEQLQLREQGQQQGGDVAAWRTGSAASGNDAAPDCAAAPVTPKRGCSPFQDTQQHGSQIQEAYSSFLPGTTSQGEVPNQQHHTPRRHQQLPSFSAFLSIVDVQQRSSPNSKAATYQHQACQTEDAPQALHPQTLSPLLTHQLSPQLHSASWSHQEWQVLASEKEQHLYPAQPTCSAQSPAQPTHDPQPDRAQPTHLRQPHCTQPTLHGQPTLTQPIQHAQIVEPAQQPPLTQPTQTQQHPRVQLEQVLAPCATSSTLQPKGLRQLLDPSPEQAHQSSQENCSFQPLQGRPRHLFISDTQEQFDLSMLVQPSACVALSSENKRNPLCSGAEQPSSHTLEPPSSIATLPSESWRHSQCSDAQEQLQQSSSHLAQHKLELPAACVALPSPVLLEAENVQLAPQTLHIKQQGQQQQLCSGQGPACVEQQGQQQQVCTDQGGMPASQQGQQQQGPAQAFVHINEHEERHQLSSPVMRRLMDLESSKDSQMRSQLVSALLGGIFHVRLSNTSTAAKAATSPKTDTTQHPNQGASGSNSRQDQPDPQTSSLSSHNQGHHQQDQQDHLAIMPGSQTLPAPNNRSLPSSNSGRVRAKQHISLQGHAVLSGLHAYSQGAPAGRAAWANGHHSLRRSRNGGATFAADAANAASSKTSSQSSSDGGVAERAGAGSRAGSGLHAGVENLAARMGETNEGRDPGDAFSKLAAAPGALTWVRQQQQQWQERQQEGDRGRGSQILDGRGEEGQRQQEQQETSQILGMMAVLHMNMPRPFIGDQVQKGLTKAMEAANQAFSSQERRQKLSSWGPNQQRMVLYETH